MRLLRAILLRLLYGVLSLLFIVTVTFVANEFAPGDPALVIAGDKATPEQIQHVREAMHLNRPAIVRYGEYFEKLSHFDLGQSYYGTHEEVSTTIRKNFPMTLELASIAMLLAAIIGIILGVFASIYQNRLVDRSVLTISTLGVTLPNFVFAPLLVGIFALWLNRLPQAWEVQRVAPDYYYLILPVIVLAARPMAMLTRLTRASMIDTMQQEFIRTAIAKGVPTTRLILRHALRNAILPVITAIGTSFGYLLTGSFVVERYFSLPGIGREAIEAINRGDTPVIQACILITGSLFIILNLIVDMILPILDPRIRESQV